MKGKIQVILVLLLFAGAILGIGALTYSNRVQEIDTQLVKTVKLDRIPVQTQKVVPQSLTENLVATGVRGAEQDYELRAFLHAMTTLCRGLGINTIAEHVETAAQAHLLRDLGADYAQGFYYGHPLVNLSNALNPSPPSKSAPARAALA